MTAPIRVATRGSALARWQAERVVARLGVPAELVIVTTTGDRDRTSAIHAIGGNGVFVKEVQEAVRRGDADVAVHSAKDLPPLTPDDLVIARGPRAGRRRATRWSARRWPTCRTAAHGRHRLGAPPRPARRAPPRPHVRRAPRQRPDPRRAGRRLRRRGRRRRRARAPRARATGSPRCSPIDAHAADGRPGRARGRVPGRRRATTRARSPRSTTPPRTAALDAERGVPRRARRRLHHAVRRATRPCRRRHDHRRRRCSPPPTARACCAPTATGADGPARRPRRRPPHPRRPRRRRAPRHGGPDDRTSIGAGRHAACRSASARRHAMTVYLVGAGPGDPGLITVRGAELLGPRRRRRVRPARRTRRCSTSRRPTPSASTSARRRAGSRWTRTASTPRSSSTASPGRLVVRLKGGDPFVFGRGGEEAEALIAAGVPFEVVPGITSAIAAPAYAGIPVTHRGLSHPRHDRHRSRGPGEGHAPTPTGTRSPAPAARS